MSAPDGPVALVGDAHLREGDAEVGAFVRFLDGLPAEITTLGILGDLFAAWIGRPELQRPHHRLVVQALRRLRGRGCAILYVEGNHDFFLAPLHAGDPFDRLAGDALDLRVAGRTLRLEHGDLVNRGDRQYLAWRAVSKNRLLFGLFNLLPRTARLRIVDRLERSLANTNLDFRTGFPLAACEVYARERVASGADIVVFGHFHDERQFDVEARGRRGSVFVLPAWRERHRYLRIDPLAEPAFVSA